MFQTSSELRPEAAGPRRVLAPRFGAMSFAFVAPQSGAPNRFASLSMAVPGQKDPSKFTTDAKTVKEAATGLEFSAEFCPRDKSNCSQVAGLGVRAKRILGLKNINVYAVGLYVDAAGVRSKLGKYKGRDAEELVKSSNMYKDFVASSGVEKTLRLIINYGNISSDTFSNALKERMEPGLKSAGELKTMEKFTNLFTDVKFRKGLDITFTCAGDTMTTRIDGKEVGKIISPKLNEVLLNVYVGDSPVSEDAKKNFATGLVSILSDK